ncbi:EP1-like glycoprotein 2 [Carex rostrata]
MALTLSLAIVALLLCFSFSVNPQTDHIYPTVTAPTSWTNSPSLPNNSAFGSAENFRYLLLLPLKSITSMAFAIGFYCSQPCKSYFLSICIMATDYNNYYSDYYLPVVIWSANRAHPVSENATLQLTSKDGLTLCDSDGSQVWSTSGLNRAVTGINITDIGNLVLFDINNSTIWQSFDHPTDCLVMGQTLAGGMNITANSSSTNFAEGQFYLTILANGLYGFVNSNPPVVYYSTSPNGRNNIVDNT